jgi:hypothetical protein
METTMTRSAALLGKALEQVLVSLPELRCLSANLIVVESWPSVPDGIKVGLKV